MICTSITELFCDLMCFYFSPSRVKLSARNGGSFTLCRGYSLLPPRSRVAGKLARGFFQAALPASGNRVAIFRDTLE